MPEEGTALVGHPLFRKLVRASRQIALFSNSDRLYHLDLTNRKAQLTLQGYYGLRDDL